MGWDDLPRQAHTQVTPHRLREAWVKNGPLSWGYGCSRWTDEVVSACEAWVQNRGVAASWDRMIKGEVVNPSEGQAARHHYFRSEAGRAGWVDQVGSFVTAVREGTWRLPNGNRVSHVVQVGIGGSELGPKAAYEAMRRLVPDSPITAHFIASMDGDEVTDGWAKVDPDCTLWVLASKSGDTLETMVNYRAIAQRLRDHGIPDEAVPEYWVGITTQGSAMDDQRVAGHFFYVDPTIGGRFSSTSAMGCVVVGLCGGIEMVQALLAGASEMDQWARQPFRHNMALMSAMMGAWERVVMGSTHRVVVAYSQALSAFPAHVQQVECESNGKQVTADGRAVGYPTAPLVTGGVGTQCQHSFFQQLHQGTDGVPVELIGVGQAQSPHAMGGRDLLVANLASQAVALAVGNRGGSMATGCPGNRPVTMVWMNRLTAYEYGALLAYIENRAVFQGFIWGLNPFDQPGVQWGKQLCRSISEGDDGLATVLYRHLWDPIESDAR